MLLRIVGAAILGVFFGGLAIAGMESIIHSTLKGESAFAPAILALGLAAVVGGAPAAWLGRSGVSAWLVAGGLGALSLVNVFSFPHPVWFTPAAGVSLLLGGWVASRVAVWRRREQ